MKYRYDEFNNNEFETHRLALRVISDNSRVLDMGCATGYMAKELAKKSCKTWGVDNDPEAVKKADEYCEETALCDLNKCKRIPFERNGFDYVLMLDVIEHLTNPENILSAIRENIKKDGRLIISTPNFAHASVRWMMARGKLEYTETGMMDRTHVHFYTRQSFEETLSRAGYRVDCMIPTNGMTKVPALRKFTDRINPKWQYRITSLWPTMFAYQWIAVAQVKD